MQTDFIQKQLQASLTVLKNIITEFEQQSTPSKEYIKKLHSCIQETNTLVSAHLILQEQNSTFTKTDIVEPLKESITNDVLFESTKQEVNLSEPTEDIKIIDELKPNSDNLPLENKVIQKEEIKELPKIAISINDKFRFINELFDSNAEEFNVAIEQLNSLTSLNDYNTFIEGLQSIYLWKETNEVVKHFYTITKKRFV